MDRRPNLEMRVNLYDLYDTDEPTLLGAYVLLPDGTIDWDPVPGGDSRIPDLGKILADDDPDSGWLDLEDGEAYLRRLPSYLFYRGGHLMAEVVEGG